MVTEIETTLRDLAASVRIRVDVQGSSGCTDPNVLVFFTDTVKAVLQHQGVQDKLNITLKTDQRFGGYVRERSITQDKYDAWAAKQEPIKYWHRYNTLTVRARASIILANVTEQFRYAAAFVDRAAVATVDPTSLAQHIAFVVMTGVAPYDYSLKTESILNLFDPITPNPRARLTDFDRDYLEALHTLPEFRAARFDTQARTIGNKLCREGGHCE